MGGSPRDETAAAHSVGSYFNGVTLPGAYAPGFMLPPTTSAYYYPTRRSSLFLLNLFADEAQEALKLVVCERELEGRHAVAAVVNL